MKLFTYDFVGSRWSPEEKRQVVDVLLDQRGWKSKGFLIVPRDSVPPKLRPKKADFTLDFRDPADMPDGFPNLSVTWMSLRPRMVWFNTRNWNEIPAASGYKTLAEYRAYLINHEVGHAALGLDHTNCADGDTGPAPIMMQQTKGTGTCHPHPWLT